MKLSLFLVTAHRSSLALVLFATVSLSLGSASSARAQQAQQAQQAPIWAGMIKVTDFSYKVWACNPANEPGSIRLINDRGATLFNEYSSSINFGQQFNIERLPDGLYSVIVKRGKQKRYFSLHLQSSAKHWAEMESVNSLPDKHLASASAAPVNAAP